MLVVTNLMAIDAHDFVSSNSFGNPNIFAWLNPMLVWYIGDCMVMIINNINGNKMTYLWVTKLSYQSNIYA